MPTKQHKIQRLSQPSAPGTLLKRTLNPQTRTRVKEIGERDAPYLAMIRECPCVSCGHDPCGTAAHVRLQSAAHGKRGGMLKKPADKWAVPLCESCHTLDKNAQHKVGEVDCACTCDPY